MKLTKERVLEILKCSDSATKEELGEVAWMIASGRVKPKDKPPGDTNPQGWVFPYDL